MLLVHRITSAHFGLRAAWRNRPGPLSITGAPQLEQWITAVALRSLRAAFLR
jgi:hypothetical protein